MAQKKRERGVGREREIHGLQPAQPNLGQRTDTGWNCSVQTLVHGNEKREWGILKR